MPTSVITVDQIILSPEVSDAFQEIRIREDKNDENRREDLYGPYEAVWLERAGKLPPEYYEENDPEPWKLLPDEARRNILWQALSGCLDINKEWAFIYIQLVMDRALNDNEFATELKKINTQFLHSLDHRHDHHHGMKHKVGHIDCPGCSATAGLLMIDPVIREKFESELHGLQKLHPKEREALLKSKGLDSYLNMTIQDEKDGVILLPN